MSTNAFLMMLSVFNPRKSILITPASSITLPSICVSHSSESFEVQTGIKSVKSFGAMIIPAAWIPVLRTEPSRISASCKMRAGRSSPLYTCLSFFTVSSSSGPNASFSLKLFSPVKGACNTLFNDTPGRSGTNLDKARLSGNGRSITRATSAMLDLAAIVP